MTKNRYPMIDRITGGAFKEAETMPYLLTYTNPKLGGSVEIELSTYVDWSNRLDLRRDKDSCEAIKKGLREILERKVAHTLVPLDADQIFKTLNWHVAPVTTA